VYVETVTKYEFLQNSCKRVYFWCEKVKQQFSKHEILLKLSIYEYLLNSISGDLYWK
jgi:hypothetical protein